MDTHGAIAVPVLSHNEQRWLILLPSSSSPPRRLGAFLEPVISRRQRKEERPLILSELEDERGLGLVDVQIQISRVENMVQRRRHERERTAGRKR